MALAATGLLTHAAAQAQGDKTIGILVGFPPGGSLDTVARLLAEKMKDELKAPTVVENKPGAGGRVAADMLKSAPADGTALMATPVVVPVLAPLVFSKLNDNPATDFAPVGHVASFNFAFTVPTALPVKTVAEFVAWVKTNPDKANFGSPAPGSLPHFFDEIISRETQTNLVHVPYSGGAPLMNALLGDRALNKALARPDVLEGFAKFALEPGGGSAADQTRLEQASTARWATVVKATGFRAD